VRNLEFVTAVALLTGCSIVSSHTGGQALYYAMMTVAVKGQLARVEGLRTATGHRIDALVRHVAGHHRVKNELTIESAAIAAAER
jgi:hypothetical protein